MTTLPLREDASTTGALSLLVLSSILWASSFVSVKIGLAYVNAYNFVFLRLALAASTLLVLLILRGRFRIGMLKQTSVWTLGLLNGLGFSLQYLGLLFTTPAKTALLIDLNVLVVAVLSWWMFQESFSSRKKLGVLFGVVGALMITTNGDLSTLTQGEAFGDVLVFTAGLVWALFIVLHKRVLIKREQDAIDLSALVMITTAIFLLPTAIFFGHLTTAVIPNMGWELVAYTAVACSVLPYAMWVVALRVVTATVASVVSMLEIVAAMLMSALLLGEAYSTVTLLGAMLVLASIFAVAES
jgi:drug/metabolite transporter (DMT)-like permease